MTEMYKRNAKYIQDKPIINVPSHSLRDPKSSQEIQILVGSQLKKMYEE